MRLIRLRARLLGALAVCVGLAVAASPASAASFALDSPDNGSQPLIAFDPTTNTTYVAWAAPNEGQPGAEGGVDLCVLPPAQTACEGGGPVLLEDRKYVGYKSDNAPGLGGLVVLPGGKTVVVGTSVATGSIAWASPPGGAAFLTGNNGLQNGGQFISPVSLFYTFGNAVAISGSDVGLLDDSDHPDNNFSDSSLTAESPPLPEEGNSNRGGKYGGKAIGTDGPELAAEPAPAPAPAGDDVVVGVGQNESGPAISGCLNDVATGYGVSVGQVDGASSVKGTLNGGGLPPYQPLACAANLPVLAQGGAGIGLIEQEGSAVSGAGSELTLDYRPFLATALGGAFGAPVQVANLTGQGGIDELDLAEDSGTGVYATWVGAAGLMFDYSANGGATWGTPLPVPEPPGGYGDPVIAGAGGGTVLIAYESNPGTGSQVFLESVNYAALYEALAKPAPTTLTTTQTSGGVSGADIVIRAGTVGETDQATLSGANAAVAGGTVTYQLYSSSSCTGTPLLTTIATVTAGKAAASAPIVAALGSGTYYWQASYSGDSRNAASASACGSEILTVASPTPTSEFKVEAIVAESDGTITITIVVEQSGKATLEVTISTTTLAHSAAVEAKRHKSCKHGQIKLKGRCVAATTVVGKTSAEATAGVPLKLTVHLSNKVKALLKKGKTVHLTANLTFQSSLGAKPTTHTYAVTVRGRRHKK
jgi:hypothetical protein